MPQAMQPWEYNIAPCYSKSTAEKKIKKTHAGIPKRIQESGYLQKDARCWSSFRTGKKNAPVCS
mgnify:FL=1